MTIQAQIKAIKEKWVDKHVKVIGKDHPHCGNTGTVKDFKPMGSKYALVVESDDGFSNFAVFNVKDLKII